MSLNRLFCWLFEMPERKFERGSFVAAVFDVCLLGLNLAPGICFVAVPQLGHISSSSL